jgi:flagellar biosynthesis protein FliR
MPADWLTGEKLTVFLAVLARVSAALFLVPLPGLRTTLTPVKAIFAVAITLILSPSWPAGPGQTVSAGSIVMLLAGEAAIGLMLGLVAGVAVESLVLAAQIVSLQAGYSYASTIDPASEADSSVLPVFAQLTAGLLFLSSGLDRAVFGALAGSLQAWPPGANWASPALATGFISLGSVLLEHGLRLALPVVSLLLLTDLTLSILARVNAQLPLLSVSFSVKMLAALVLLATLAPVWPASLRLAAEAAWRILAGLGQGRLGH